MLTKIEWTEATWNPITGCTKLSEGCANCYAERMAHRLLAMGQPNYRNGFQVTCHEHLFDQPHHWKKPRMIFVNSMGDIFHDDVPDSVILTLFDTMNKAHWHTFQLLTKRSKRLEKLSSRLPWAKNIWMGVTVENQKCSNRIEKLKKTGAHTKFLSMEPLLGPVSGVDYKGIDWIIVGGESGPGARPMQEEWVLEIKTQCVKGKIPFFFKQWGGVNKKKAGRELLGRVWEEMPEMKGEKNV